MDCTGDGAIRVFVDATGGSLARLYPDQGVRSTIIGVCISLGRRPGEMKQRRTPRVSTSLRNTSMLHFKAGEKVCGSRNPPWFDIVRGDRLGHNK